MIKFIKNLLNTVLGEFVWSIKMSDTMGLVPMDDK